jgi:NADPH:quinone reductase-like Zn-dependent oxidoreductase
VTSAIGRTYPLAEAAAAVRHLMNGQARGKVVLSIGPATTQNPDPRSTT